MKPSESPTIFGYSWDAIQSIQQGTYRAAPINLSMPSKRPATDKDRALLAEHGEQGLRDRQLYGVLDRLNLPMG
jgi:hypothetical protein